MLVIVTMSSIVAKKQNSRDKLERKKEISGGGFPELKLLNAPGGKGRERGMTSAVWTS